MLLIVKLITHFQDSFFYGEIYSDVLNMPTGLDFTRFGFGIILTGGGALKE